MSHRVVALVALRAPVIRGRQRRADLSHLPYARASWEWWCAQNGVEFIVVDRTPADARLPSAPATVLRWSAPAEILATRPRGTRLALVDADTMVRWDTPDFFACYDGRLGAAHGLDGEFIARSTAAFQPLFPGVTLKPAQYFNAGIVLAGKAQLELFAAFVDFYAEHREEIGRLSRADNVGTDQTPLNFLVRRERHPVAFLPRALNLMYCFGWRSQRMRRQYESGAKPDWSRFERWASASRQAFAFIDWGYLWHFTNTVTARSRAMAETWRRVRQHYR